MKNDQFARSYTQGYGQLDNSLAFYNKQMLNQSKDDISGPSKRKKNIKKLNEQYKSLLDIQKEIDFDRRLKEKTQIKSTTKA